MILATAAILVLAAQLAGDIADGRMPSHTSLASTAQTPMPPEQGRTGISRQFIDIPVGQADERITPTAAEMELLVTTNFRMMDKDQSGYIEPGENLVRVLDGPPYDRDENEAVQHTSVRRLTRLEYFAPSDKDGDGKWNFNEFREWLTPHLRAGIPARVRTEIEGNYRQ